MEFEPEFPKSYKKGMYKFAIVFPNKTYGGVYSLGPLIIYNLVNLRKNWICHKFFEDYLGNLENYDIIAFSVSWELDFKRVVKILKRFNLKDKIVAVGGPAVMINPNPFKKYFDVLFLFEAEAMLDQVLDIYEESSGKDEFLNKVAELDGVIVPGIKEKTKIVKAKDLNKVPYPLYQPFPKEIDKKFVFGKVFMLEVARGCPFNCKFCVVPYLYSPYRIRKYERLIEIVEEGYKINQRKKIILYAPVLLHPNLKDLLNYLLDEGFQFSLPSLRPEIIDQELLELMVKGGQRTLTLAPETGNENLRFWLNKRISDDKFVEIAELAKQAGIREIKLYFMIGLPNQEISDAYNIIELSSKIKEKFGGRVYISVSPFVPKRNTTLENYEFDRKKVREMKKILIREARKRKIRIWVGSEKLAYLEWKFQKL